MLSRLLPKSAYARNIITLMTGTGLAQAIPIAASPLLTRLYSPGEFGVFALFTALVTVMVVWVTGRYELAILLPKLDRDAIHIVVLAIFLSFFISLLLSVAFFFYGKDIANLFDAPELEYWLFLIPVSSCLMGIYQSLNYWSNRKGQYKRLAISRTIQSAGISAVQLGNGYWLGSTAGGLIGGRIIGQSLAVAVLGSSIWREDKSLLLRVKVRRVIQLAKKYKDFPRFLVFAHTLNSASFQMPVMLLSVFFGASSAGFYTLTQQVLSAPMILIAGALGDVFRQEASQTYIHQGSCQAIYEKTFKKLFLISLLPFLVFFIVAPDLFSFVFGEQWRIAGKYAQILTPMFFLQFITSPLSVMFMIAEKQRLDLLWQSALFIVACSSLFLGNVFKSVELALILFSSGYSFMYVISGIMSYRFSMKYEMKRM